MPRALLAGVALAAFACALPAAAQEAGRWSGKLGVASDYMDKGISLSDGVQGWGRLEWSKGAIYAGGFASNVDLPNGGDAEVRLYGGWNPEAWGYDFDLGLALREFPGTDFDNTSVVELSAEAGRAIGPLKARLHVDWSPDTIGPAEQAWWIEGRVSWAVTRKTELGAAVGRREEAFGPDYTAWNVGVRQSLSDRLAADVRWYDTNGHRFGDPYDGRVVGALTFSF
jgi:uncharacterized protein (TIGR02001 family)